MEQGKKSKQERENDKIKKEISAPCKYMRTLENGKQKVSYPAVDCDFQCTHCGWNPVVAKRRIAERFEQGG